MIWRRNDGPPEESYRLMQVPASQLRTWLVYDSQLPDRKSIAPILNLTPASAEVEAMEERASRNRLHEVAPIQDIIQTYSKIVADVSLAVLARDHGSADPTLAEQTRSVFEIVSSVSISAFLAAFMDLGLIHGHYPVPEREDDGE